MYVEGNPVNMLDPTGKSPNPLASNGYAEGLAVTTAGVFAIATITGTEIVYDFATMQSAVFNITGRKDPATEIVDTPTGWCTSFFGVTTSPYITPIIVGFDYDSDISQYQGNVKSKQLGVDVLGLFGVTALADVALSLGGGGVVFSSETRPQFIDYPDTWGVSFYVNEIGLGLSGQDVAGIDMPISLAGYSSNYTLEPGTKKQYHSTEEMITDIRKGYRSPYPITILSALAREYAVEQLRFIEDNRN
jgi:hypothetical protein